MRNTVTAIETRIDRVVDDRSASFRDDRASLVERMRVLRQTTVTETKSRLLSNIDQATEKVQSYRTSGETCITAFKVNSQRLCHPHP